MHEASSLSFDGLSVHCQTVETEFPRSFFCIITLQIVKLTFHLSLQKQICLVLFNYNTLEVGVNIVKWTYSSLVACVECAAKVQRVWTNKRSKIIILNLGGN